MSPGTIRPVRGVGPNPGHLAWMLAVLWTFTAVAWVMATRGANEAWMHGAILALALAASGALAWREYSTAGARGAAAELSTRLGAEIASHQESLRQGGRLRAILDAVPEGVMLIDERGRVAAANPAAEGLAGPRGTSPVGRGLEEVFTHAEVLALYARARQGEAGSVQARVQRGETPRVHEVSARAIDGGVVLVVRDVTELAQTVQLKSDFAANASHELRTPLAAIRLAAETLREGPDEAMEQRLIGVVLGNTQRLEDLVRDLLDLSRVEGSEASTRREEIDLPALLAEVAARFEGACAPRGLSIAPEVEPGFERFVGDARLLELVLGNLIENATKFAHDGTTIRVVAGPAPEGHCSLRLRVIDRGMGIPVAQQQRIFERFYQVDDARSEGRERRGTGLGLAIVKHAVRRMRGAVSVESVWGHGTTMVVDLPGAMGGAARTGGDV